MKKKNCLWYVVICRPSQNKMCKCVLLTFTMYIFDHGYTLITCLIQPCRLELGTSKRQRSRTDDEDNKKWMKRSSLFSDSGVVNHRGLRGLGVFAGGYGSASWADTLPQGTYSSTMVEGFSSAPQTNAKLSEQHVTVLLIARSCPPPRLPYTQLYSFCTIFPIPPSFSFIFFSVL